MDAIKDQSACPDMASGSKLRYPLRSAGKKRDEKSATVDASSSSASRRSACSVSKSVNVLDLSAKDKSSNPPRRLSVPSKSAVSPRPPVGSISSISETRTMKSSAQGKSGTPISDTSKSMGRKKFSVLSSISYWLSQIKLSESASKHSISLGFFKLALESGCEPVQRMRDELKSYLCRHNLLTELGEPLKDLLKSYNILEDLEQLQITDTCSQVLEKEGTKSFSEGVHSPPTSVKTGSLKPKSKSSVGETLKTARTEKRLPAAKSMTSSNRNPSKDANGNTQKKLQKPNKLEFSRVNAKGKNSMKKKSTSEKADPLPVMVTQEEDKENKGDRLMEAMDLTEGTQENRIDDIAMDVI